MKHIIQHNKELHQFSITIENKLAYLNYKILPDQTLDYYITFVPPEFRGQHIGDEIVLFALNYAKENHFKVIPSCPFVMRIIERHSEYKDLISQG